MTMLSAERSGLANLEWDEGFAMPVADSHNKQLEKQVSYSELDIKQVKTQLFKFSIQSFM